MIVVMRYVGRGVLPALRLLVAMQTCVNIEKILPEARIPSDLNIY